MFAQCDVLHVSVGTKCTPHNCGRTRFIHRRGEFSQRVEMCLSRYVAPCLSKMCKKISLKLQSKSLYLKRAYCTIETCSEMDVSSLSCDQWTKQSNAHTRTHAQTHTHSGYWWTFLSYQPGEKQTEFVFLFYSQPRLSLKQLFQPIQTLINTHKHTETAHHRSLIDR